MAPTITIDTKRNSFMIEFKWLVSIKQLAFEFISAACENDDEGICFFITLTDLIFLCCHFSEKSLS